MNVESITVSSELIKVILVEGFIRGKQLYRILMNYVLSGIEFSGDILDLGSGLGSSTYNRFIKIREPYRVTLSDYYKEGEGLVKINLEEPFKIGVNSFDYVTCISTLEHIYDFRNVLKESYLVLKKGGKFVGCTPFLHRYHPDPSDYFRYSHEALMKMFAEENYVCEKVVYVGFGPFSVTGPLWHDIFPKKVRRLFVILDIFNILLDLTLLKISKSYKMLYPLSYVYVFRKGS